MSLPKIFDDPVIAEALQAQRATAEVAATSIDDERAKLIEQTKLSVLEVFESLKRAAQALEEARAALDALVRKAAA